MRMSLQMALKQRMGVGAEEMVGQLVSQALETIENFLENWEEVDEMVVMHVENQQVEELDGVVKPLEVIQEEVQQGQETELKNWQKVAVLTQVPW